MYILILNEGIQLYDGHQVAIFLYMFRPPRLRQDFFFGRFQSTMIAYKSWLGISEIKRWQARYVCRFSIGDNGLHKDFLYVTTTISQSKNIDRKGFTSSTRTRLPPPFWPTCSSWHKGIEWFPFLILWCIDIRRDFPSLATPFPDPLTLTQKHMSERME